MIELDLDVRGAGQISYLAINPPGRGTAEHPLQIC